MRIVLFGIIAVPLAILDALALSAFPAIVTRFYSAQELVPALGGAAAYLVAHFLVRKPERLYLWGHEFTHLIVAKLFFKRVHGFHITSRDGGKVVIDGTNLWIDLAPYLLPFYGLLLLGGATLFRPAPPWGTAAYLAGAGFAFALHATFSIEGFLQGQPDLRRSGRFFSLALVVLFVAGVIPALLAPGTTGGWGRAGGIYTAWGSAVVGSGKRLLLLGRGVLH